MPMNAFLVTAVLLGISIVGINVSAFYRQRRRSNPGPWLRPAEVAKLTAILSVLFALLLVLSALA